MHFEGNFRKLGKLDPKPLQAVVARIPPAMWAEFRTRQHTYEAHANTQTIPVLLNHPDRHLDPKPAPIFRELIPEMEPVVRHISTVYGYQGWIARCILTRLPAGAEIPLHTDSGFSLQYSHRVHIPIFSSEGVRFRVGEEYTEMAEGELWEINNIRPHAVGNHSAIDRVHMILDWAIPLTYGAMLEYLAVVKERDEEAMKSQA